jgi:ketosteroid isomerase-like protein
MGPKDPIDMHRLFAEAFNAPDLDALVALYEPEAVLVPQAGQRAAGRDAIREASPALRRLS